MNTPLRNGFLVLLPLFALAPVLLAVQPGAPAVCTMPASGGELVVTRFLAAPLPRAHEILADAMQATGVILYKNTEQSIEGERVAERIKVLHLPAGDEAITATLTPATDNGASGTQVQIETMRRSFKKGDPKRSWSAAVMNQAVCLLNLLSVDDPWHRPVAPISEGVDVHIPASTPLDVRSRRFFFNTDLKNGQLVPFETAGSVVIDGTTVIPRGSLVGAAMTDVSDSKSFGRAARGHLVFKYVVLPDGTRLPLSGEVDFTGKNTLKKGTAAEAATLATTAVLVYFGGSGPLGDPLLGDPGLGFAVPAGSMTTVHFDGDQKCRASRGRNVSATPNQ